MCTDRSSISTDGVYAASSLFNVIVESHLKGKQLIRTVKSFIYHSTTTMWQIESSLQHWTFIMSQFGRFFFIDIVKENSSYFHSFSLVSSPLPNKLFSFNQYKEVQMEKV